MIRNDDFHGFDIICNLCGETQNYDTHENFDLAISEAKLDGWTMKKMKDKSWEQYCPDCSE